MCCTSIPNNTAPDGSVTRAIQGLTAFSQELAENDPFTRILESWSGRWSGLISSLLVSLAVAIALISLCGCCCIPCIRGLIETAMAKTLMYQQILTTADAYYHNCDETEI